MIGVGTIRFRLTAAYALLLTVMVAGTAVWSWVAARQSLSVTVDRSLERDMAVFQTSVQMLSRNMDIGQAIQRSTTWGVRDILVRVFDANGALVYESASVQNRIMTRPPDVEPGQITFRTVSGPTTRTCTRYQHHSGARVWPPRRWTCRTTAMCWNWSSL